MCRDSDKRERGQRQINQKDASDDFAHRKAVVGGALIEMSAMSLPDRLAPHEAMCEGDRGVGEIIEGQDERRCQMTCSGKLQQDPAEQKSDRQAAYVAEKDPRHRSVERREANDRTKECRRD